MLIKAGVDISRLNREIRRAMQKVALYMDNYHEELIISSTYEGTHGAGSLHYANDAIDVRNPKIKIRNFTQGIKDRLGDDYDVVDEHNHIHIEYDQEVRKREK